MESRSPDKRSRKPPAERRAEILAASARVALTEGLECITLRRVAEILGVRGSLIGHYFPADDLVAETFGTVAEVELDSLIPPDGSDSPRERMARFVILATSPVCDDTNRLWVNARHLARYRPSLRERVITQGDHWRNRLSTLIQEGVDDGSFTTEDPDVAGLKILAVVDGLSADLNADPGFPPVVLHMAIDIAEQELGLAPGTLEASLPRDAWQRFAEIRSGLGWPIPPQVERID
jgi:AcrR family transcriptional regulator